MIDISKPYQTRSGLKVFDLEMLDKPLLLYNGDVAFIGGRVMNKEGRGEYYRWTSDGASTFDSQMDLVPVTADLDMKIDDKKMLGFARTYIQYAMRICNEIGFMFDTLVHQARYEDKLIRMDRKYRTRNGGKPGKIVRLLCTDGPGNYPVVGFVHDDTNVYRWTAVGGHGHEVSAYDLVEIHLED